MQMIKRILVPTDFTPASMQAAGFASWLASRVDAEVELFHALEKPSVYIGTTGLVYKLPWVNDKWIPSPTRMALTNEFETLLEHLRETNPRKIGYSFEAGRPSDAILARAAQGEFDLIVISSATGSGHNAHRTSDILWIVRRKANCPVLSFPSPDRIASPGRTTKERQIRRILVPTDYSHLAQKAAKFAWGVAGVLGAELILLHVVDGWPGRWLGGSAVPEARHDELEKRERLRQWMQGLEREALARPLSLLKSGPETLIEFGQPGSAISRFAYEREIDLIVMGTHGPIRVASLVTGNVADEVARHTLCPVITIGPMCSQEMPRHKRRKPRAA